MTTQTHNTSSARVSLAGARVTFGRVLRSEWRKYWSLRATWILFLTGVGLTLAFAALGTWAIAATSSGAPSELGISGGTFPTFMVTQLATSGFQFGALLLACVIIVNTGGEFSTHTIVSTFSAVPSRTPAYLAKAAIAGVVGFVTGFLAHLAATGLVLLVLKAYSYGTDVGSTLLRHALVSGLVVLVLVWLALGFAALLRNTAGAIVTLIGLVVLVSMVLAIVTALAPTVEIVGWLSRHLPMEAVGALRPADPGLAELNGAAGLDSTTLGPLDAWLTTAFWGLVPLVAGWFSFKYRAAR